MRGRTRSGGGGGAKETGGSELGFGLRVGYLFFFFFCRQMDGWMWDGEIDGWMDGRHVIDPWEEP